MDKELFVPENQQTIERLVSLTGNSVDYYEQKARLAVNEMLEDEYDAQIALERINTPNRTFISLEELEQRLGLDTED